RGRVADERAAVAPDEPHDERAEEAQPAGAHHHGDERGEGGEDRDRAVVAVRLPAVGRRAVGLLAVRLPAVRLLAGGLLAVGLLAVGLLVRRSAVGRAGGRRRGHRWLLGRRVVPPAYARGEPGLADSTHERRRRERP